MSIEHEYRLTRTMKRLNVLGDSAEEGTSVFPATVKPADMTLVQLTEAREAQIPATMISLDGEPCWLIVLYKVKKPRKKATTMFYSKTEGGLVKIPWLEDASTVTSSEFTLGGWPFPLKSLTVQEIL